MSTLTITAAPSIPAVLALLEAVDLPSDGIEDIATVLIGATDPYGRVVACAGIERLGNVGLLRSVAVAPSEQGTGIGKSVVAAALDTARANGITEVVLLTTTAAGFFEKHFGFARSTRERYDDILSDSVEWRLPRCSSAVVMRLDLTDEKE